MGDGQCGVMMRTREINEIVIDSVRTYDEGLLARGLLI